MSTDSYLLAGQAGELERLQLGSRMWEPAGRRLLGEIGDGQGARALDVGCGALGWLRLLSQWVGPDGPSSEPTSTKRCWPPPNRSWPTKAWAT